MAVKVNAIAVPRIPRNKRNYGGYVKSEVRGGGAVLTGKAVIEFENTNTPLIEDYNTLYAPVYGQFPTVTLYVVVAGARIERTERPYFTFIDGLIDTISFGQLDDTYTGFITISK